MKNWNYSQEKALAKALYRSIHLCRCNPDYRLKHVAEAKLDPKRENISKVNIEARKRIEHDIEAHIKMVTQPSVARPARFNRSE